MRYYLGALLGVVLLVIPWFAFNYPEEAKGVFSFMRNTGEQLAAVILAHKPKTVADIQSHYDSTSMQPQKRVRILVMPGHEPAYGGAEYGDLKERDMTVELGQDLAAFLRGNSHYDVVVARDQNDWLPDLANYFKYRWNDIIDWQKASHAEESHLIAVGSTTAASPKVYHNSAPLDVALRLYGITKWANENDIDITLHIHFNDYPGHPRGSPGKYSGFAIYVPASQYGNSVTTKTIADTVFKRLSKYNAVSDFPGESTGIVDEPDLIAVGADNTADSASMLLEYGYIYEEQFTDPALRSAALRDLAFQTYLGLQDFFDPHNAVNTSGSIGTLLVPTAWTTNVNASNPSYNVFALQTALISDGVYPPGGKSKNDCPRSGNFGPCTKEALQSFQDKYGIVGESGVVGPKTLDELNSLYRVKAL